MSLLSSQEMAVLLRKIIDHHCRYRSKIPRRLAKEAPEEARKLDQLLPPPRLDLAEPCQRCGKPKDGWKYCRSCAREVKLKQAREARKLPLRSKEQRKALVEQRRRHRAEQYRELIEAMRRGESQQDWADKLGQTRQAVHQIYRKYERYLS